MVTAKLPAVLGGKPISTVIFLTIGVAVWWCLDLKILPANFGRTLRGQDPV